jgi:mono/diheme cytochrome c family protein
MNDRLDRAIRSATGDIVAAAPIPPSDPVAAARRRHTIPFWVLPALVLLPVFGFMYVRALAGDATTEPGPLSTGASLYSKCASCHGATGQGVDGQGYPFSDGEVLATFPRIEDHLRFVYFGTDRYRSAGIDIYGDPNRPGGPHLTGERGAMPPFGDELSTADIVAVVCHERYTLGGADPANEEFIDEYEAWCSPDAPVHNAIESGALDLIDDSSTRIELDGTDIVISAIGPEPTAGRGRE